MEKKILIKTGLPGPRSKTILEKNKKYRYPQGPFTFDFVAERAEDVFIEDGFEKGVEVHSALVKIQRIQTQLVCPQRETGL